MTADRGSRGQAFTLEGVIAAIVVLVSVVLALQAVDIAPFSSGGADSHTDRLETQVSDVLATASDRDALRTTVTCVRPTGEPESDLANPNDPLTRFGELLNQTLAQNGNEFIVAVEYLGKDGLARERVYPTGEISAPTGAVSASRQVTLYKSDPVNRAEGDGCEPDPDGTTIGEYDLFYIDPNPDLGGVTNLHNTVRVKVVAW